MKAATNIAIRNPETGRVEVFTEGDDVPAWASKLIDNEDVLTKPAAKPAAKD